MEKKINNILFLNGKDGSRLTYRTLFTYHSEKTGKDYAAFYNEDDENDLIAFSYDENITLSPLQSEEEYEELNQALCQYDEEQANRKE